MIYCGTINKECIAVHPLNDINNTYYVEIIKHGNKPQFDVCVDDGEGEWIWEFDMACPSDYERVKMNIFDVIFACDTMFELAEALNAIFENEFDDILIEDDYEECNGCDGCNGCDDCIGCDGCDGCEIIE